MFWSWWARVSLRRGSEELDTLCSRGRDKKIDFSDPNPMMSSSLHSYGLAVILLRESHGWLFSTCWSVMNSIQSDYSPWITKEKEPDCRWSSMQRKSYNNERFVYCCMSMRERERDRMWPRTGRLSTYTFQQPEIKTCGTERERKCPTND